MWVRVSSRPARRGGGVGVIWTPVCGYQDVHAGRGTAVIRGGEQDPGGLGGGGRGDDVGEGVVAAGEAGWWRGGHLDSGLRIPGCARRSGDGRDPGRCAVVFWGASPWPGTGSWAVGTGWPVDVAGSMAAASRWGVWLVRGSVGRT